MTYKEIVDRIAEVVDNHLILQDFGYGNLSDIKANNEGNESADYPYAFLNPTNHSRSGQSITYRFNLIVMDMVLDNDYLKIQSECQQYVDDILAALRFSYTDQVDLTLNVSLTPFKERFQDVVAGMTATLEVVIPNRLSDCYKVVPTYERVVLARMDTYDDFAPDIEQSPMQFKDIIETDGGWRPPNEGGNYYKNLYGQTETFKVVVTGTTTRTSGTGNWPTVPDLANTSGPGQTLTEPNTYTWPTDVALGKTAEFTLEWTNVVIDNNEFVAVQFPNEPPIECELSVQTGTTITVSKLS